METLEDLEEVQVEELLLLTQAGYLYKIKVTPEVRLLDLLIIHIRQQAVAEQEQLEAVSQEEVKEVMVAPDLM